MSTTPLSTTVAERRRIIIFTNNYADCIACDSPEYICCHLKIDVLKPGMVVGVRWEEVDLLPIKECLNGQSFHNTEILILRDDEPTKQVEDFLKLTLEGWQPFVILHERSKFKSAQEEIIRRIAPQALFKDQHHSDECVYCDELYDLVKAKQEHNFELYQATIDSILDRF